ncbi:MAG: pilus assembly protein TadG-related protein [Nocardioidaceae bacterium]
MSATAPARLRAVGASWRSRRDERGYAAMLVAVMCPIVFLACAALSVDTARWYVEAERVQSVADAAALAGVVWMPANFETATTTAVAEARKNGYDNALPGVVVTVEPSDKPSQLKVTVASTVKNTFGSAIGTPTTTVARSSTADFSGGLSMGSPCNVFASDPDTAAPVTSANCSNVGDFWANVAGPMSNKKAGDAFQAGSGCSASIDGCTGTTNTDYDPRGHFYTVDFKKAVTNPRVEVFDPALVNVGDQCERAVLTGASSLAAANTVVTDPATRYAEASGKYCTGDVAQAPSAVVNATDPDPLFAGQLNTRFTVYRMDANSDPGRPWTWPVADAALCPGAKNYRGFNGKLSTALDKTSPGYQPEVAASFRRWVTLCTSSSFPAGTTLAIQVRTNDPGNENTAGHNRFSLRAYSATAAASNADIAVAAFNKMAIYANVKNGSSRFFLTKVPSAAAGQTLNVSLFDIGDLGGATGTITFEAPTESGVTFGNCQAVGVINGPVANCQFTASTAFDGKWQSVYIPIPQTYSCADTSATGCWVKLNYQFPSATNPTDTTAWKASIDGQPVRLVK